MRPSWAEIDPRAIRHNVEKARSQLGPHRKIYFVCKGDGFGFGAASVARLALQAGVDALCVGGPEEAQSIRDAGIHADILLFASTLPADAAAVADLGVIATLQSPEAAQAFIALGRPLEVFVEIDCGFGRFGLTQPQWCEVLELLRGQASVRLRGIYSHLSSPEDAQITAAQAKVFEAACHDAEHLGFVGIEKILASSRVMILHPGLSHTGVDPGRYIYGALDRRFMQAADLRPLLAAVRGRIIHVQSHAAGSTLGLGYGAPIELSKPMRLAVVPIGFWDGLNHAPPLGDVIVHGRRTSVIGRRSFQHTVIDVSDIPEARVGSVVTLLGRDGDAEIAIDELAATMRLPVMEAVPRLARSLPHVHLPTPISQTLQEKSA